MIACASADGVSGPKFIVPRQRRLTDRPERPRLTYSIRLAFHGGTTINLTVRGHPLAGAAGGRAVAPRAAPAHVHEWPAARWRGADPGRRSLPLGQQHGQRQGG